MLFELTDIKRRLDEQPVPQGLDLPGLRLQASKTTEQELNSLETALTCRFPQSFRQLVLQYDFGDLTLGGVVFGTTGDYGSYLRQNNLNSDFPWWRQGKRPPYIVVAGTDGYEILISLTTGEICAFLRTEEWTNNQRIAKDFELFVRGSGTVYLARKTAGDKRDFGIKVSREVGGITDYPFWPELALGIT